MTGRWNPHEAPRHPLDGAGRLARADADLQGVAAGRLPDRRGADRRPGAVAVGAGDGPTD